MKNLQIYFFITFISVGVVIMKVSGFRQNLKKEIKTEILLEIKKTDERNFVLQENNEFRYVKFREKIAFFESSNRWNISKGQYVGKYQFGKMALKDLKLWDVVRPRWFRKNPQIFTESVQDRTFDKWMKIQWKYLRSIHNYEGKVINGILLTKSGMCAGSHLVGYRKMIKFVESNGKFVPKDGNGTPVTKYLAQLGGYDMPF